MALAENATELSIEGVIGYSGEVSGGLCYTPCGQYLLYPLGSIVVIRNLASNRVGFLEGHTSDVSCIAVSHDGQRLATGQANHGGVKAPVIVWDLDAAKHNC